MSITAKKIREIRESEGISRPKFAAMIEISPRTLETIENRGSDPATEVTKRVCKLFPEYAWWLTMDETRPEKGDISPELKKATSTYNKTGTDTD